MHTRIEDNKILVTLDFSLALDERTGGYFVVEKDGPPNLNHETQWGPMPRFLVEEFIRQRSAYVVEAFDRMTKEILR